MNPNDSVRPTDNSHPAIVVQFDLPDRIHRGGKRGEEYRRIGIAEVVEHEQGRSLPGNVFQSREGWSRYDSHNDSRHALKQDAKDTSRKRQPRQRDKIGSPDLSNRFGFICEIGHLGILKNA